MSWLSVRDYLVKLGIGYELARVRFDWKPCGLLWSDGIMLLYCFVVGTSMVVETVAMFTHKS